jgi:hypothetical protein
MMGGTGPADAATGTFIRDLAYEIGPKGIRVLGIWTAGLPETMSREQLVPYTGGQLTDEAAFQGVLNNLARMLGRSP